MGKAVIEIDSLKSRLDKIDNEVFDEVFDNFYESRKRILLAEWGKGEQIEKSVVDYRGVNSTTKYSEMYRNTGRDRSSLKKWHNIYLKYKDINDYIPHVEKKALEWTNKAIKDKSSNVLVQKHTGNQENYTPKEIIDSIKNVIGNIDLDPASCEKAQEIIKAKKYYTQDEDGLSKEWNGSVFLNPPYQMPEIRNFTDKLLNELENISSAILLTNNNTDTIWFHNCANKANAICFTKGRINFYTEETEKTFPTNGQAFFYFGENVKLFIDVFSEIGIIMGAINGE